MSKISDAPLSSLADAEDVIEVKSYEEMAERPGFCRDIDPNTTKLSKIIGFYRLQDKPKCGLSNCHTPHNWGYLVVTEDGRETNIGNVCGRNEFGAVFQVLRNKFQSRRRVKDYQERLGAFRTTLADVHKRITTLRKEHQGADWLNTTQEAFRKGCSPSLFDEVRNRARTGNARIFETRTLTGEEAELRKLAEGKADTEDQTETADKERTYTVEELVAELHGLSIWNTSIRALLIEGLQRRLIEFEGLNVFPQSEHALRKWVEFAEGVEATLEKARTLVEEGREFFTDENVALLTRLPMTPQVRGEFRRRQWDNKKGAWH